MTTVGMTVSGLRLSNGVEIPRLGLDLYAMPQEGTQRAVEVALEAGYRHLDTAAAYGNEREAGAALAASGLPRRECFLATKLWCLRADRDAARRAFETSLERLGLDYVDLCLAYWPVAVGGRFAGIWEALERLREEGAARAIGVANFGIGDLELLRERGGALPAVNQVELHPRCQEPELLTWHAEHRVATEAWSPLAQDDLLGEERSIAMLAERHGKTLTQVVLRWHLQLGNVVVAGSDAPERIRENLDVFDFALSAEEMAAVARLDSSFALVR